MNGDRGMSEADRIDALERILEEAEGAYERVTRLIGNQLFAEAAGHARGSLMNLRGVLSFLLLEEKGQL